MAMAIAIAIAIETVLEMVIVYTINTQSYIITNKAAMASFKEIAPQI